MGNMRMGRMRLVYKVHWHNKTLKENKRKRVLMERPTVEASQEEIEDMLRQTASDHLRQGEAERYERYHQDFFEELSLFALALLGKTESLDFSQGY